jgi:ATP-dependent protease ClpP protease subunit
VTAEDFVKDINDIKTGTINIRINSPGGSVFDGTAMFNAINQHKLKTIVYIDGLAASISSVIAMGADEVKMGKGASLMIHNPWSYAIGDSKVMRREADLLDKIGGTIASIYMEKTGKTEAEIKEMMEAETWLSPEESLEDGFVDSIDKIETEKAQVKFDLSMFSNVPDKLKDSETKPTARQLERTLRDAGCTNKQAKAILADGFKDDALRDEENQEIEPKTVDHRDVDTVEKKDRISELINRAEKMAPSSKEEENENNSTV